jgi:hypothetical protein
MGSAVVARAVALKGTTNRSTAGCTGGHAGTKQGPCLEEGPGWDQYRGAGSGVRIFLVSGFLRY